MWRFGEKHKAISNKHEEVTKTARKGNRNVILVIIIMAIIAISAYSIVSPVQAEWQETTEAGSSFYATLVALHDGGTVKVPFITGAFSQGGVDIDAFLMTITWVSTGDSVVWSTFVLSGTFKVYLQNYDQDGSDSLTEFSESFTSTQSSGEWSQTLTLGEDVCQVQNMVNDQWRLYFEASLDASVQDTLGTTLTDSLLFTGTAIVIFDSDFSLTGGMTGN